MFKNYFKTAIRNLRRNRAFAIINILGLVLGISGTIVIYRIITFEKSFDTYHTDVEQVYRMNLIQATTGVVNRGISVMHPLRKAVRTDFPEWKVAGFHNYYPGLFTYENNQGEQKKLKEDDWMAFVEPDYFKILDHPLVAGSEKGLLEAPNTMALSTTAADKLFGLNGSGYQEILGKTLRFENKLNLQISAVFEAPPKNTDFGYHYLMFYEGAKIYPYAGGLERWGTINGATKLWIKLPKGQTQQQANALLKEASKDYLANLGVTNEDIYFALEPIQDIHLDEETGPGGYVSESTLNALQVIALVLILTAAINFVNLATAQSVKRAKEIGIRKVLGSHKKHLITQFLSEVFLITTLSVLLSLALSEGALIRLEPLLGYKLINDLFSDPGIILILLGLNIKFTILAGFYTAMVLANYNPVQAIKSSSMNAKTKGSGLSIRRFLVVFQFLISQFLIIATLVIVFQMQYMQNFDLGFDTEAILAMNIPEQDEEKMALLKSRIGTLPGTGEMSFYIGSPSGANINNIDEIKNSVNSEETFKANRKNVDYNYAELYDLQVLAGEFYRSEAPEDACVINRKFAEELGFNSPEAAIGERFETRWGGGYRINAVVENFYNNHLNSTLDALYMMPGQDQYFEGGVKLAINENFKSTIDGIDEIWSEIFPDHLFSYDFVDERIAGMYDSERQIASLIQVFAALAILIGCLGLYGLVSFMANQKVKEIGIRKVLGATVTNILTIFSREVLLLLVIAFLLAAPLGYYLMNGAYLDNYAYSISIGAQVFVVAIMATVIIATCTVGMRAFRAATANPVRSLKDD